MRVVLLRWSVVLCVLSVFITDDAEARRGGGRRPAFRRPVFAAARNRRQFPGRPVVRRQPQRIVRGGVFNPGIDDDFGGFNGGQGNVCIGVGGHAVSCNVAGGFPGGQVIGGRQIDPNAGVKDIQSQPIDPGAVQPVPVSPRPNATEPVGQEPPVCSNAKAAICGDTNSEQRKQFETRLAETRKSKVNGILANIGLTGEQLTASPVNFENFRRYAQQLRAQVEVVNPEVEANRVRTFLERAVRKNAPGNATAMIIKLRSVEVVSFAELAQRSPQLMRSFLLTCGPDGMSANAAYFEVGPGGRPVQAMCPYYLSADATPQERSATMGHELGHSIDSSRFPGQFTSLMACLNLPPNLHGEASADFWMTKAAAESLQGQGPAVALDFASKALDDYCAPAARRSVLRLPEELRPVRDGRIANPVHPEGDFRLAVLFAQDPDIRQRFGCRAITRQQGAPQMCSLNGPVN